MATADQSGGIQISPPSGRRVARWAGILAIAFIVIAILAYRWKDIGFEWSEFTGAFERLDWAWVALSAVCALATYPGRALRWRVLMRGVKEKADLWNLTSATAIGFSAIVVLGRAGELVRPYLIAVKEKVPFSSQLAAWFMERIYDLLTALLIFGFALIRVRSSGVDVGPALTWVLHIGGYVAGALGIAVLSFLVIFTRYAEAAERRLLEALAFLPKRTLGRIQVMIVAFRQGVVSSRRPNSIYLVSLYSLGEWTLILLCYGCLFRAFPATMTFSTTDVVIFVGFVAFGAVVQLPGVGGGLQVVSVLVLTELFQVGLEAASGLALLIWLVTFVIIMPIGMALGLREGLSWNRLKSIKDETQQL